MLFNSHWSIACCYCLLFFRQRSGTHRMSSTAVSIEINILEDAKSGLEFRRVDFGVIWNLWTINDFRKFLFSSVEWSSWEISYEMIHHKFIAWDWNAMQVFSIISLLELRLRDWVQPKTACIADCITGWMNVTEWAVKPLDPWFSFVLIKTVAGSQGIRRMHRKIIAKCFCFGS